MSNLVFCLAYFIGVLMGCIITNIITNFLHTRAGKFEIDQRGPHDIYRVSFDIPMEKLPKKKYLLLKVDKNADLISKLEEELNEQNGIV